MNSNESWRRPWFLFWITAGLMTTGLAIGTRADSADASAEIPEEPGFAVAAAAGPALSGDGPPLPIALLSVTPSSREFGSVEKGQSASRKFFVVNSGYVTLFGTASVNTPFSIVAGSSYTVAPGATGTVTVLFSPTQAKSYTNKVIFLSNGGNRTNLVTGTGMPVAKLLVTPPALNFGAMLTGTTAEAVFAVTNAGDLALTGSVSVAAGPFSLPTNRFAVAAFSAATVTVQFAPAALGDFSNRVIFASNGGVSTNLVRGIGAAELTRLIGLSGGLAFGNVATGKVAQRTLTITNLGNQALAVTGIACPSGFSGTWTGVVAAGRSRSVIIAFAPSAVQAYGGDLTVASDATGGAPAIAVSGAGVEPAIELRFASASFGAVEGGVAKVMVRRYGNARGTASVAYRTKPGTALAGRDYISKTGTLAWADGDVTLRVIRIKIPADGWVESRETFKVLLARPVNAVLATPFTATVAIAANTKAGLLAAAPRQAAPPVPLAEALDGAGLEWRTSETSPWTGQAGAAADGSDAAVSGGAAPGLVSWLETEAAGAGRLEFDWRVAGSGADTCLLFVDGQVRRRLGPGAEWAHETLTLGEGTHRLRWIFAGETRPEPGGAFADRVRWSPVP